jgi:hypothetical protein
MVTDDRDDGPFLTKAELREQLKIGRTHFIDKVASGEIPPPDVCLGPRSYRGRGGIT